MPRLFDLLSEDSRKELIDEKNKIREAADKRRRTAHKRGPGAVDRKPESISIPDFVALDVETTGLDFKNDRIIEIGAAKFRGGHLVEEFSTFINPRIPLPHTITDLTGITENDLINAPVFSEIAEKLLSFIEKLPLCGHQIEFDSSFLKEELKRLDKPAIDSQLLDTALLSRILLDPHGRFSLKDVCNALEVSLDNAHRALHDARAAGEAAIRLIPRIAHLPLAVRRALAACAPQSLFRTLMFKSLPDGRPEIAIEFPKVKHPSRLTAPDRYCSVDRKNVEDLFSGEGKVASFMESYIPRPAQLKMALGVTDALNTGTLYIAEAGTGTGKSLAYLLPAALWAMENSFRVVVSTNTRNLQDQLVSKDLPVAAAIFNGDLKYTVLKGRRNYLCINRLIKLLQGSIGNISPRERFAILPLIVWATSTDSGDIEEQNLFNPKWFSKIWSIISAEHHECAHRRCPLYQSCFFQKARNRALGSHIVVINHALFFTELCAQTSFLYPVGPIIFDEAHHLESCGHRFLKVELDTNRINLLSETLNNLLHRTGEPQDCQQIYECGKRLKASLRHFRKKGGAFLDALIRVAKEKNPSSVEYQMPYEQNTFSELAETDALQQAVVDLTDCLSDIKKAFKAATEPQRWESLEAEAQICLEQMSQLKADLIYLTAAQTDDHVFWTEGNIEKGWAKLCGVPLDVGELLSEVWGRCEGAVVFTSATLSVGGSFDYFKRKVGLLQHQERTAADFFKSPFGAHQSIAAAVRNSPEPDCAQFPAYCAETIALLHCAFRKNMLVLFTSNSMLSSVYQLLRVNPSIAAKSLLAQGMAASRRIMLEEFKKNSQMILLGADSFWEGIDVPSEACEIVVIPRLPFPVPTHPLTQALARRIEMLEGESFYSFSVPEAVIRFRQGCGRLIRTSTDRGAIVVLDNRIVNRGYGKQFIRSIESDFRAFENTQQMIDGIADFFSSDTQGSTPNSDFTYVPLEEA